MQKNINAKEKFQRFFGGNLLLQQHFSLYSLSNSPELLGLYIEIFEFKLSKNQVKIRQRKYFLRQPSKKVRKWCHIADCDVAATGGWNWGKGHNGNVQQRSNP